MAVVMALAGFGFVLVRNERDRRAALTWSHASPFERSGTTNYAAWKAFERANMMSANFAASGFSRAIRELERAVALDPNYAGAWSGLSESLFLASDKGVIPAGEALRRGLFCAEQAVKLKPANGWFLHWLGECNLALDYDFARAEPQLRKAVQLAPEAAALRHNLAVALWFHGRFDEAAALENQLIREQPSMGYSHSLMGLIHASRGQFADALNSMGECILLLPNWPMVRARRSEILWALNRRVEAAQGWLKFIELEGFASLARPDAERLNTILKEAGPDQFVRKLVELLEERRAAGRFSSAYDLAKFHAMLGNRARALDYLELAVDEHRLFTLSAKVHITFRDFQDEPRYHAVLRRLKLENESVGYFFKR
jgi:tetratricopeptide (TPR) repeat protein